ncbi:hypothetical protein TUM20985_36250 [Mycobacterium antarcticum]|nr:hypothetical protein TUM20985_36250 [Mycolicibacterium sp. TUM20985]GLP76252.1 hypothetical protein TUM20983_33620 [Mycolicibacterium sp. TUM20983]GLP83368.1 hypothetical protein TUM20984_47880 [Mycolicibacterium sp. TUM20984]
MPTRSAAGSAAAVIAGALEEVLLTTLEETLLALLVASLAVSLEHAEVPRMATAVRPAAVKALR